MNVKCTWMSLLSKFKDFEALLFMNVKCTWMSLLAKFKDFQAHEAENPIFLGTFKALNFFFQIQHFQGFQAHVRTLCRFCVGRPLYPIPIGVRRLQVKASLCRQWRCASCGDAGPVLRQQWVNLPCHHVLDLVPATAHMFPTLGS